MPIAVRPSNKALIVVTKREAKPTPPSSSEKERISCGTKIAVSAPPTTKL